MNSPLVPILLPGFTARRIDFLPCLAVAGITAINRIRSLLLKLLEGIYGRIADPAAGMHYHRHEVTCGVDKFDARELPIGQPDNVADSKTRPRAGHKMRSSVIGYPWRFLDGPLPYTHKKDKGNERAAKQNHRKKTEYSFHKTPPNPY